jgi:hypothetical protein
MAQQLRQGLLYKGNIFPTGITQIVFHEINSVIGRYGSGEQDLFMVLLTKLMRIYSAAVHALISPESNPSLDDCILAAGKRRGGARFIEYGW